MAVCDLRTLLLIVCVLELIVTAQRQIFDFLGYMWMPIVANFMNLVMIIFGCFGAVQYITKYLLAFIIWTFIWLTWNTFLICYYLNLGSLNRESGLLSLGTGSVSWWEGNGWGCQPVWSDVEGPSSWRPTRVDGCLLAWSHIELAQSSLAGILAATALPLIVLVTLQSHKKTKSTDQKTMTRHPVYTIELSPTETMVSESSKPMTPRRVKRRSGSRSAGSVRRSRRSYRNAGYLASTNSLSREPRESRSRPTSAHSSYSNFHAARPSSYHVSETRYDPPPPVESVPNEGKPGYDVTGPYKLYEKSQSQSFGRNYNAASPNFEPEYGNARYSASGYSGWEAPPPPAPPYCGQASPQAPGPPAYQPSNDYVP